MTREDFVSNAVALVGGGHGWQTRLAKTLNINLRTIQRAVKDGPSKSLARVILDAIGESAPQTVHARWIVGQGIDGREYLVHTQRPRFRCLIVQPDDDYDLEGDDGVQFMFADETLAGFHWIDAMPDDIASLMEAAASAIEEISVES